MKLWMDDVRPMPDGFDVHAKTALETIEHLKSGKIVEVSLDHDLGDDVDDYTGYFVAMWIESQAYLGSLQRLKWSIHSANPVGKQYMEMALRNADRHWSRHEEGENRTS